MATVRFTQNVSCKFYTHPRYQHVANANSVEMLQAIKTTEHITYILYDMHVYIIRYARVTTVTYKHQSQPPLQLLLINGTVHLELWPVNHVIWCGANCSLGFVWRSKVKRRLTYERKEIFVFKDALNTYILRIHGVEHIVKNPTTQRERKPAVATSWAAPFD